MTSSARIEDTLSIINDEITTVRAGLSLRYSQLTGLEKRDYLFDHGICPTAYANYPGEERPSVVGGLLQFSRSALKYITQGLLGQSLTRVSDELDPPKVKLFHTYGAAAKISFIPEPGTPYSGMLAAQVPGLARFSYAGPVIGIGVVPGLGLKFLIDGEHPSANLLVMRKLDRQQPLLHYFSTRGHNSVFQFPFTNILPRPWFFNLTMHAVVKRFETVVEDGGATHQPADALAAVTPDGAAVPDDRVVAPYRLIFLPTAEARSASNPAVDFRDDLASNIKPGTTIYAVHALTDTEESRLRSQGLKTVEALAQRAPKIGTIATESDFIASKYGDYRLFFKHSDRFLRAELKDNA